MALNVGDNFKQRWLNTPEAVRQTIRDDLLHISSLLEPETIVNQWQQQDVLLQHQHRKQTKAAYDQLKREILAERTRIAEEAKRQRQAELEARIEQQRELELARLAQLKAEEEQNALRELAQLKHIAVQLQHELNMPSATEVVRFNTQLVHQYQQQELSLDEIQVRLELESESIIDQMLSKVRIQLKQAAQEEIQLLITQFEEKLNPLSSD